MSLRDRLKGWLSDPAVTHSLILFLTARIGLTILSILVSQFAPVGPAPNDLGVQAVGGLLGLWQRWDTLGFQLIASVGYQEAGLGPIVPPVYPLLMRWVGSLLGGNTLLAGILISNLAYLAALVYFFKLTAFEFGTPVARRATVYLAVFPTAFFYMAAYSESLLLLCLVASFYHARRGQWWTAGAWGFLSPLVRLQAVFALPALVFEYLRQKRSLGWDFSALVLAGIGNTVFPLYVWLHLGDRPWAPLIVHTQRFHGQFAFPWQSLAASVKVIASRAFFLADVFDLAFALLFLGLIIAMIKNLPPLYTIYSAVAYVAILSKVGPISPLLSTSRYILPIFPAFMLLGKWSVTTWRHRLVVYPSLVLLAFLTGQFILWGWVA